MMGSTPVPLQLNDTSSSPSENDEISSSVSSEFGEEEVEDLTPSKSILCTSSSSPQPSTLKHLFPSFDEEEDDFYKQKRDNHLQHSLQSSVASFVEDDDLLANQRTNSSRKKRIFRILRKKSTGSLSASPAETDASCASPVEVVIDSGKNMKKSRRRLLSRERRHKISRERILDRITFRKRREDEDFVFWALVMICSIMALAILCCIAVYLSRTDFFLLHQDDLLGSTVDERFTVLSQSKSSAQIMLKSGYSASAFSEAVISLQHDKLGLGRRYYDKKAESIKLKGIEIDSNGSVVASNELSVPTVVSQTVHAQKALVFADGTTMTTAADVSGGLEQKGDLNLASLKGAIILSAGGQPRVQVQSDGKINLDKYMILDGPNQAITLGEGKQMTLSVEKQQTILKSDSISLKTNNIFLGDSTSLKKIVIQPSVYEEVAKSNNDDSKRSIFEIRGQDNSKATMQHINSGGDLGLIGGTGAKQGGNVILSGGKSANENSQTRGNVYIQAVKEEVQKETHIGSLSSYSRTLLKGNIELSSTAENTKISLEGSTVVKGSQLDVQSQHVIIGSISSEIVEMNGGTVDIGSKAQTGLVQIGNSSNSKNSKIMISGGDLSAFDSNKVVHIGTKTCSSILIGRSLAGNKGQVANISTRILSDNLEISVANEVSFNNSQQLSLLATKKLLLQSANHSLEMSENKLSFHSPGQIQMASGNDLVLDSKTKVQIGGDEGVEIGALNQKQTITLSANQLTLQASQNILLGDSKTPELYVAAYNISLNGLDSLKLGTTTTKSILIGHPSSQVNVKSHVLSLESQSDLVIAAGEKLSLKSKKDLVVESPQKLSFSSPDVSIGVSNISERVVIGRNTMTLEMNKQDFRLQNVKSISIGSDQEIETITIGSKSQQANTNIQLYGKVTVNGVNIGGGGVRFLSEAKKNSFVYADCSQCKTLSMKKGEKKILFYSTFRTNDAPTWQFNRLNQRIQFKGKTKDIYDLKLQLHNVRIQPHQPQSKIALRCKVLDLNKQVIVQQTMQDVCVCKERESCSADNEDNFFGSFVLSQIVQLLPGSELITECTSNANGQLRYSSAQLSLKQL